MDVDGDLQLLSMVCMVTTLRYGLYGDYDLYECTKTVNSKATVAVAYPRIRNPHIPQPSCCMIGLEAGRVSPSTGEQLRVSGLSAYYWHIRYYCHEERLGLSPVKLL